MGHRTGKRKWHSDNNHRGSFKMNETGVHGKRRRLSSNVSDLQNSETTPYEEENGWQKVESKRHRKRHGHGQRQPDSLETSNDAATRPSLDNDDGPALVISADFDRKAPIQVQDLRDLALYILADEVAPTWLAVKAKRGIRKVVVVMLPGLDDEMLRRASELKDIWAGKEKRERNSDITIFRDNAADLPDSQASKDQDNAANESELQMTHGAGRIRWLLDNRFPVKVSGDSRYSKVHSPLQSMLMKADDKDSKRAQSSRSEPVYKSVRTPITDYIHTADELREAEYPIHPAAFTSEADAVLETERRAGTLQNTIGGWVDSAVSDSKPAIPSTSIKSPQDILSQGLRIYAVDCEMVITSDGKSSLARVSVVSWPNGEVVLDEFVKPTLSITNYFTQYSGITPEILENVTTKLPDIQSRLQKLLTPSTILLGHSLESDLNALKMTHPFIIDTSMLFPHPRGLPLRSSLKFLSNKYLKREIQTGANGHNSTEDARAVLDLVKLKCEKGPKFGTSEANGETIFNILSRLGQQPGGRALSSAIVEYGTPERGIGKDATFAIGCSGDGEVVEGVIGVATGEPSHSRSLSDLVDKNERLRTIPSGGVDFVWGRLRALEFARGWVTNRTSLPTPSATSNPTKTKSTTASEDTEHPDTVESSSSANPTIHQLPHSTLAVPPSKSLDIDSVIQQTISHLNHLHSSLRTSSSSTLLILYSGLGSTSHLNNLHAQQQQYRKEFKTRKWDDLTVKWTDVEEQALRNAYDEARKGWAWVGLV